MALFTGKDRRGMDRGVEEFRKKKNAVLVDVRSRAEYAEGHVPGSINIPLTEIPDAQEYIPSLDTPVYVYCHSGTRSRYAAMALESLGFENTENIGGLEDYTGELTDQ